MSNWEGKGGSKTKVKLKKKNTVLGGEKIRATKAKPAIDLLSECERYGKTRQLLKEGVFSRREKRTMGGRRW